MKHSLHGINQKSSDDEIISATSNDGQKSQTTPPSRKPSISDRRRQSEDDDSTSTTSDSEIDSAIIADIGNFIDRLRDAAVTGSDTANVTPTNLSTTNVISPSYSLGSPPKQQARRPSIDNDTDSSDGSEIVDEAEAEVSQEAMAGISAFIDSLQRKKNNKTLNKSDEVDEDFLYLSSESESDADDDYVVPETEEELSAFICSVKNAKSFEYEEGKVLFPTKNKILRDEHQPKLQFSSTSTTTRFFQQESGHSLGTFSDDKLSIISSKSNDTSEGVLGEGFIDGVNSFGLSNSSGGHSRSFDENGSFLTNGFGSLSYGSQSNVSSSGSAKLDDKNNIGSFDPSESSLQINKSEEKRSSVELLKANTSILSDVSEHGNNIEISMSPEKQMNKEDNLVTDSIKHSMNLEKAEDSPEGTSIEELMRLNEFITKAIAFSKLKEPNESERQILLESTEIQGVPIDTIMEILTPVTSFDTNVPKKEDGSDVDTMKIDSNLVEKKMKQNEENLSLFLQTGARIASSSEKERTRIEKSFLRLYEEYESADIAEKELLKILPNLFKALKNESEEANLNEMQDKLDGNKKGEKNKTEIVNLDEESTIHNKKIHHKKGTADIVKDQKRNLTLFLRMGAGISSTNEDDRTAMEKLFLQRYNEYQEGKIDNIKIHAIIPNLFLALRNEGEDEDIVENGSPQADSITSLAKGKGDTESAAVVSEEMIEKKQSKSKCFEEKVSSVALPDNNETHKDIVENDSPQADSITFLAKDEIISVDVVSAEKIEEKQSESKCLEEKVSSVALPDNDETESITIDDNENTGKDPSKFNHQKTKANSVKSSDNDEIVTTDEIRLVSTFASSVAESREAPIWDRREEDTTTTDDQNDASIDSYESNISAHSLHNFLNSTRPLNQSASSEDENSEAVDENDNATASSRLSASSAQDFDPRDTESIGSVSTGRQGVFSAITKTVDTSTKVGSVKKKKLSQDNAPQEKENKDKNRTKKIKEKYEHKRQSENENVNKVSTAENKESANDDASSACSSISSHNGVDKFASLEGIHDNDEINPLLDVKINYTVDPTQLLFQDEVEVDLIHGVNPIFNKVIEEKKDLGDEKTEMDNETRNETIIETKTSEDSVVTPKETIKVEPGAKMSTPRIHPINAVASTYALKKCSIHRSIHLKQTKQRWKMSFDERTEGHDGYYFVDVNSLYESSIVIGKPHYFDYEPWEDRDVRQRFLHEKSLSFVRNWFGKYLYSLVKLSNTFFVKKIIPSHTNG